MIVMFIVCSVFVCCWGCACLLIGCFACVGDSFCLFCWFVVGLCLI